MDFIISEIILKPLTFSIIISFIIVIILLGISALMSGSEVAFFSLSPENLKKIKESKSSKSQIILMLLDKPEELLATLLIVNNLVNIGIVVISTYITSSLIDFQSAQIIGFIFQVVIVTFLILFFGEIMPKVFATYSGMKLAYFAAIPLFFLSKIIHPFSRILIYSTKILNKSVSHRKQNISITDLSGALDLTSGSLSDEKNILEGIVKFGNIDVKEIMTPRIDLKTICIKTKFSELLSYVNDSGYSRLPVYKESIDNIKGVLHTKDLLPYLKESENFNWHSLIRKAYFVPETKKINDLLEEFQQNKIHLAIVTDEYGGTLGIVTMEDIMEEIVGEINDEFDTDDKCYTKIDDNNYIFEGKTLLNDFYKIVHAPDNYYDDIKGDADTLAGLILEIKCEIPKRNEKIKLKKFIFKIESADNRRIKQVKVVITD